MVDERLAIFDVFELVFFHSQVHILALAAFFPRKQLEIFWILHRDFLLLLLLLLLLFFLLFFSNESGDEEILETEIDFFFFRKSFFFLGKRVDVDM